MVLDASYKKSCSWRCCYNCNRLKERSNCGFSICGWHKCEVDNDYTCDNFDNPLG